jgi:hypothetical protein
MTVLTYLVTIGAIFALLVGLILVERLYRRFAARNPELGPFRQPDKCMGCSAGSKCNDDATCATSSAAGSREHGR